LVRGWDSELEEPPGWPLIADRFPVDVFFADADSDQEAELFVVSSGGMIHALSPETTGSGFGGVSWPAIGGGFSRRWSVPTDSLDPLEPSSGLSLSGLYAYPNPCRDDEIYFRYRLNRDCDVTIEVFDQEGQRIDEFPGLGTASDNAEPWDVSSIASGVYLAKVSCKYGNDEEFGFIRFAVVR
jgi:hypothetical protein